MESRSEVEEDEEELRRRRSVVDGFEVEEEEEEEEQMILDVDLAMAILLPMEAKWRRWVVPFHTLRASIEVGEGFGFGLGDREESL